MGAGMTIFQSFVISGCVSLLVPVLMLVAFLGVMYMIIAPHVEKPGEALERFETFTGGSSLSMQERILRRGDADEGTIALVKVHGEIGGNGSTLDGTGSMSQIADELRAAVENKSVKAILLQIDSPGGGLTASDLLYHEVKKIHENGMPVVVWAGGTMASGGYYIAMGAGKIIASPTATIGSIGVIMQHFQVSGLLQKLGIEVNPVTSGERKDIGSVFRKMTPEERAVLQNYIEAAHERFVSVVAEGRNLPVEDVRKLADGGIFTIEAALEAGLIDSVGYLEDAIFAIEEEVGATNMRIIGFRRTPGLVDFFRDFGEGAAMGLVENAVARQAPEAMAVWE